MANDPAAKEWLTKAWHHLSTANILYNIEHYTDIVGVEVHYSLEITLKSLLMYENKPLKKTHELYEIYTMVKHLISLENDEIKILVLTTEYHILEAYPSPHRKLPPREEIRYVLDFANTLFERVCTLLNIDSEEVKK